MREKVELYNHHNKGIPNEDSNMNFKNAYYVWIYMLMLILIAHFYTNFLSSFIFTFIVITFVVIPNHLHFHHPASNLGHPNNIKNIVYWLYFEIKHHSYEFIVLCRCEQPIDTHQTSRINLLYSLYTLIHFLCFNIFSFQKLYSSQL